MTADHNRPPWKRKRPAQPPKKLSARERHEARTRARAAGRKYPNLVDNMAVIRKRKTARKKTARASASSATGRGR